VLQAVKKIQLESRAVSWSSSSHSAETEIIHFKSYNLGRSFALREESQFLQWLLQLTVQKVLDI